MINLLRIMAITVLIGLTSSLPAIPAAAIEPAFVDEARTQLLDSVGELADPTQAGKMVVYGQDAFVVANFSGADESDPLIAAATWGAGRVVALGDHQFLNMNNYGSPPGATDLTSSGRFYLNGIEWLGQSDQRDLKIVVARSQAKAWLEAQGFTNVVQTNSWVDELDDADLLVGWLGSNVSDADLATVSNFVRGGGGLFIADYGAGYQWWWGGDITASPGNRLLRAVGIGFSSGYGGGLTPTPASRHFASEDILAVLATPSDYTETEQRILGEMTRRLLQVLEDDDVLRTQVELALEARSDGLNPTPSTPVTDPVDKATLTYLSNELATMPVDELVKHPLAETLYGIVPDDAPRTSAVVSIDTDRPRWQPTGLYAAPGETVTVTVPPSWLDRGYRIRINAHTDDISPRSSWERPPVVHRAFPITAETTVVGNAFGGLIFIDFGRTPPVEGQMDVSVDGAIEAPFFVLGRDTNVEWNASLRSRPAPFAILVSPSFMISLPKHQVESANLTDPERLMSWWDEVVQAQDDLTGQVRTSAELANIDVQISFGAAHSGYPYQAYERHWGNMADLDRLLTRGSWGDFHELGHNHQRRWWTFAGDGEVSVNIMSNLSMERFASAPVGGWSWSVSPEVVLSRAKHDVAEGGTYSSKSSRWSFWFQLADGFGWDAYRNVFHGYEADAAAGRPLPTTDAEEKDQWLIRFSREVGYDLSPFMVDIWGLQVSDAARQAVSDLPGWKPLWTTTTPQAYETRSLATTEIRFDEEIHAMGPVTVAATGAAGTLTRTSDVSWSYDPAPGLAPTDQFSIVVSTDAGNQVEIPVTVTNLGLPAPTPEPTTEPTVGSTVEPTTEPTVEPTVEPTPEPTVEPTTEPAAEVAQCQGRPVTIDMRRNGGNGQGTAGDDVILGTNGGDVIHGGEGDDVICAGPGDDRVDGGPGDDRIEGHDGHDELTGGPGHDVLRGNAGTDLITGDAGNDRVLGGIDYDELDGGDGDDFIGGFGGDDEIRGGAGDDTIFGGFGSDEIWGGSGHDVIRGLVGDDVIQGGDGDDELHGDRGNDLLLGGSGNDVLAGGNANDELMGGPGDDDLSGGRADDALSGGPGVDRCSGNKETTADFADEDCEFTFGLP